MRRVAFWFILAGLAMLTRAAMELSEPAYWNPVSFFDYTAVWLTSLAGFAVAIASRCPVAIQTRP